VSVVAAVIVNRLNVAWFRMLPSAETIYVPSWQELVVTLNLISLGVVSFGLAARYLPLFQHEPLHNNQQPSAVLPAPGAPEVADHAAP
jgi:Ni/Fe-hydrogenase subunit HybB-like protein